MSLARLQFDFCHHTFFSPDINYEFCKNLFSSPSYCFYVQLRGKKKNRNSSSHQKKCTFLPIILESLLRCCFSLQKFTYILRQSVLQQNKHNCYCNNMFPYCFHSMFFFPHSFKLLHILSSAHNCLCHFSSGTTGCLFYFIAYIGLI